MRRALLILGLGLAAGAILQTPLQAQVDTTRARRDTTRRDTTARRPAKGDSVKLVVPVPPQADSILQDSLRVRDSLKAARAAAGAPKDTSKVPKDTIKAALAHAESPQTIQVGESYYWDRSSFFATGALTVQDLLDRIPGITGFRAGWLAAPMTSAYLGVPGRVRVFYDGLEIDDLDPRSGGAMDLTQIQLWTLEDVRVERGASEVRVYIRSWRVDRTTPSTRVDVSTGDQQTNMYRGFFGRRYQHGEALQVAAQQYGTTPGLLGASSDQTTLMGRVGWARGALSVDGFMLRISRHRGTIFSLDAPGDSLPTLESSRTDAYLRVAYGDPDKGPWAQAIAGTESYRYTGILPDSVRTDTSKHISAESTFTRPQYVLTGGFTRWGLQMSAAERLRSIGGHSLSTPSARVGYFTRFLSVLAYGEARSDDSLARTEVSGRLSPLSFLAVTATAGRTTDYRLFSDSAGATPASGRTTTYEQAQVGVRVHRLWLGGGILHRDAALLSAPGIFDTVYRRVVGPAATATFASIRGNIYEDLYADVTGMRWADSSGYYSPRYEARSEVGLRTSWLSRFPSGDFGLHVALSHEYRANTYFPSDSGAVLSPGYRSLTSLLEIRILTGVVFFQMRNMLGERYTMVPHLLMPRQTSIYGIRWQFWD